MSEIDHDAEAKRIRAELRKRRPSIVWRNCTVKNHAPTSFTIATLYNARIEGCYRIDYPPTE